MGQARNTSMATDLELPAAQIFYGARPNIFQSASLAWARNTSMATGFGRLAAQRFY